MSALVIGRWHTLTRMGALIGCLIGHAALAGVMPSPWWVPNLTMTGLILTVARAPHRWVLLSAVAGFFTMVWAVRFPLHVVVGALTLGWIVHLLAKPWDVTDARFQYLLVASASLLTGVGWLWLEARWSIPLIGLTLVHVAMTGLSVPVVRRFV